LLPKPQNPTALIYFRLIVCQEEELKWQSGLDHLTKGSE